MPLDHATPWHRASWDRFVQERLPQLLAGRVPLAGYHVEPQGERSGDIRLSLDSPPEDIELEYAGVPQPDETGIFEIDGKHWVVVPIASDEALETAEIRCVGEQLYDHVESLLGEALEDLPWDEGLARSWLPVDLWIREFIEQNATELLWEDPVGRANWLARRTLLRRVQVPERRHVFDSGEFGRTCPLETPEGPNIGRVLAVALGATIRDGSLVIVDDDPWAGLGLSASMIPFLEHDDANRLLMGANMMRQWMVPPDPEPALVRTGDEPDDPDSWCGRDLLTAFISWDGDAFEDGIVISESCAARLNYPHPV